MADDEQKDVTADDQKAGQESTSPDVSEQDEVVPKKAFLARVGEESEKRKQAEAAAQAERERAARLEGELAALRQTGNGNGQQGKVYSRQQLKQAVVDGQISEDEMWDIWERQKDAQIDQKIYHAVSQTGTTSRIQTKRDAYRRYVPDWKTPGTEANRKAESAFQELLADGLPRNAATEIQALKNAFGDLDTLERSSRSEDLTVSERPTHQEGGSSAGERPASTGKANWKKYISAEEMQSYDGLVRSGRMTWAEVQEQVEWSVKQDVNPKLRAHTMARVK